MEGRESTTAGGSSSAVASKVSVTYQPSATQAAMSENPSSIDGSLAPVPDVAPIATQTQPQTQQPTAAAGGGGAGAAAPQLKKKRGRPRKYAPDGNLAAPLNAMPISASAPVVEFPEAVVSMKQRGRGRPASFISKSHQRHQGIEFEMLGEMVSCSAGANFTPHVITVAAGEDVTMKVISFSQQGPRAICILSANGTISNVTLRQPDSSGGTLTYEGRFELLSLSGSFMPNDNGGTRSRSGGMSVSLAGPDGRVVGGCVAGLLVAAGPVQVVVGSFLPSYQMEQKTKQPKIDTTSISAPTFQVSIPGGEMEETHTKGQSHHHAATPKANVATSSSFRIEGWASSLNSAPDARNSKTDINISLP